MRKFKKHIASLLAIIMLFSSLATTVFAEGTEPSLEPPVNQETQEQLENQELLEEDLQLDDNALNQIPENEELSSQEVVDEEEKPPEEDHSSEENQPLEENLPNENPVVEQSLEEEPSKLEDDPNLPTESLGNIEIINVDAGEFEEEFKPSARMLKSGSRGGIGLMGNGAKGNGVPDNVPGDMAINGLWGSNTSQYRWSVIPGYITSSAREYSLIGADGVAHQAFCIDSRVPSPYLQAQDKRMVFDQRVTSSSGSLWKIAKALYRIVTGVSAMSLRGTAEVMVEVPSYEGGPPVLRPMSIDWNTYLNRGDVEMMLRAYAWCVSYGYSQLPNNQAMRNDLDQMLRLSKVYVRGESCLVSYNTLQKWVNDEWISSNDLTTAQLHDIRNTVPRRTYYRFSDTLGTNGSSSNSYPIYFDYNGSRYRVNQVLSTFWYWGEMTSNTMRVGTVDLPDSARDAYNTLIRNIKNIIINRFNTYAQSGTSPDYATIWKHISDPSSYQRMMTFDRVRQAVKIKMTKTSSNPSCTDNNNSYSFEGIQYDVIVDGTTYHRLTLDANGESEEFTFPSGSAVQGKTVILREVDNDARKTSGYALGSDGTVVLQNGENYVSVTDTPLMDPVNIIINKVDNDTGESYDKIGI